MLQWWGKGTHKKKTVEINYVEKDEAAFSFDWKGEFTIFRIYSSSKYHLRPLHFYLTLRWFRLPRFITPNRNAILQVGIRFMTSIYSLLADTTIAHVSLAISEGDKASRQCHHCYHHIHTLSPSLRASYFSSNQGWKGWI